MHLGWTSSSSSNALSKEAAGLCYHHSQQWATPCHTGSTSCSAISCVFAGKRELPAPLRNRFTEVWVPEPSSKEDLRTLVAGYLAGVTVAGGAGGSGTPAGLGAGGAGAVDACVELYLAAKAEAVSRI